MFEEQLLLRPSENQVEVTIASAGRRMGAYVLNIIFSGLAYATLLFAAIWPLRNYSNRAKGSDMAELATTDWSMPWLFAGLAIFLIYGIWQLVCMSKNGQSLGKKILGIRVLKMDGSNPGFWGTVLLREVLYNIIVAITAVALGFVLIFILGLPSSSLETIVNLSSFLATLICVVMLFNRKKSRRTLQDYLADTVVVQLPKK